MPIKEDIKEMKEIVEKATIKKFNVISVVFLIELIVVAVSAYPLFSIKGNIGIVIWLFLFAITLYTASKIEKFKKKYLGIDIRAKRLICSPFKIGVRNRM